MFGAVHALCRAFRAYCFPTGRGRDYLCDFANRQTYLQQRVKHEINRYLGISSLHFRNTRLACFQSLRKLMLREFMGDALQFQLRAERAFYFNECFLGGA